MSSAIFNVVEHVIGASHMREYPCATANSQDEKLLLHVKQYVPRDNASPRRGDLTVIGAHANGFPKVRVGTTLGEAAADDALGPTRSSMSRCGMTFTTRQNTAACAFGPSGSPTPPGREEAASSTRASWATIVRLFSFPSRRVATQLTSR